MGRNARTVTEPRSFADELLIRADATSQIGTGHIMRCMALAQTWRQHGGGVTFLSHCTNSALHSRIRDEGFSFQLLEQPHPSKADLQQTLNVARDLCSRTGRLWLIIDGYHLSPEYQLVLHSEGYCILVIDDMAEHSVHYCDILLNQNIHSQILSYNCCSNTRYLLGPRYALLRREFVIRENGARAIPEIARRILVTFGGADSNNVTLKTVRALDRLQNPDLEIRIVIGPANPNMERIRQEAAQLRLSVQTMAAVTDMPDLMAWADLAITAGGITCWELAIMGVPYVVLITAENQEGIAHGLEKAGAAMNCGWFHTLTIQRFSDYLAKMISDRHTRLDFIEKGRCLVDGLGAKRVVDHMRG